MSSKRPAYQPDAETIGRTFLHHPLHGETFATADEAFARADEEGLTVRGAAWDKIRNQDGNGYQGIVRASERRRAYQHAARLAYVHGDTDLARDLLSLTGYEDIA